MIDLRAVYQHSLGTGDLDLIHGLVGIIGPTSDEMFSPSVCHRMLLRR